MWGVRREESERRVRGESRSGRDSAEFKADIVFADRSSASSRFISCITTTHIKYNILCIHPSTVRRDMTGKRVILQQVNRKSSNTTIYNIPSLRLDYTQPFPIRGSCERQRNVKGRAMQGMRPLFSFFPHYSSEEDFPIPMLNPTGIQSTIHPTPNQKKCVCHDCRAFRFAVRRGI